MRRQVAIDMQILTHEIRVNQKQIYKQLQNDNNQVKKEQANVENQFDVNINEKQLNMIFDDSDGVVMDDFEDEQIEERSEQIKQIVNSINNLAQIFKDLNLLVIEQGSLLDRIDCNLENTQRTVLKANEQLQKALKHQESPLAGRQSKALGNFSIQNEEISFSQQLGYSSFGLLGANEKPRPITDTQIYLDGIQKKHKVEMEKHKKNDCKQFPLIIGGGNAKLKQGVPQQIKQENNFLQQNQQQEQQIFQQQSPFIFTNNKNNNSIWTNNQIDEIQEEENLDKLKQFYKILQLEQELIQNQDLISKYNFLINCCQQLILQKNDQDGKQNIKNNCQNIQNSLDLKNFQENNLYNHFNQFYSIIDRKNLIEQKNPQISNSNPNFYVSSFSPEKNSVSGINQFNNEQFLKFATNQLQKFSIQQPKKKNILPMAAELLEIAQQNKIPQQKWEEFIQKQIDQAINF